MMGFINYLINGISLGSVYAIIALGYTMVYGIAKMLNFAHGDIIMVGSYTVFITTRYLGMPTFLSVLLAVLSSCVPCSVSSLSVSPTNRCVTPPRCPS